MKTAAKVFFILGIISGISLIFLGFILIIGSTADPSLAVFTPTGVMWIIYGIVMIIMCAVALGKLGKARRASDISVGFKVCVLLFGSLIGGILLLCMKDSDYSPESVWQNGQPPYDGYPPQNGQPPYNGYPPQNGQPPYNGYPPQYGQTPPPTNPPPFDETDDDKK